MLPLHVMKLLIVVCVPFMTMGVFVNKHTCIHWIKLLNPYENERFFLQSSFYYHTLCCSCMTEVVDTCIEYTPTYFRHLKPSADICRFNGSI